MCFGLVTAEGIFHQNSKLRTLLRARYQVLNTKFREERPRTEVSRNLDPLLACSGSWISPSSRSSPSSGELSLSWLCIHRARCKFRQCLRMQDLLHPPRTFWGFLGEAKEAACGRRGALVPKLWFSAAVYKFLGVLCLTVLVEMPPQF